MKKSLTACRLCPTVLPDTMNTKRDYIPNGFGKKLREYRLARLWNMEQMSKALGISLGTLHKYEHGKGLPTPLTAAKMRRLVPQLFEDAA